MSAKDDMVTKQPETSYNADGNVHKITAKNAFTGDQVTEYVYGTALSDSEVASRVARPLAVGSRSDKRFHHPDTKQE